MLEGFFPFFFGRSFFLGITTHSSSFLEALGLFSIHFVTTGTPKRTVGSLRRLRVSGVDLAAGCGRVWLPSSTTPLFLGGFTSLIFFTIRPQIRYSKESKYQTVFSISYRSAPSPTS